MIRHTRVLRRGLRLRGTQFRTFQSSTTPQNDYELDLITLKKQKKKKPTPQTTKLTGIDNLVTHSPLQKEPLKLDDITSNLNKLEDSINHRFEKIEDVLKVISKENTFNSVLMQDLKSTIKEKEEQLSEEDLKELHNSNITIQVKSKDLEAFLRTTKHNKDLEVEEHFRAERAFESSLPRMRSLEKKNFFTPIDENLIRSVRRGTHPSFIPKEDDLFFPTIPKTENNIHEFMVIHSGQKTISETNPLGPHHYRPDLVTLMRGLGSQHDKKYWKLILKLEKQKWNLIAIEGYDDDKVLVFERNISPDELKKLDMYKWLKICYAVGVIGLSFYTLGYYYENQSLKKKLVDETTNTINS